MNTTEAFIYLCACAATGAKAKLDSAPFDELWQLAQAHNLTALVAKALQDTEAFAAADTAEQKRWTNALNNNIKKTMLFEAERKKLVRFFEENGIWYAPLKGVIINTLFPAFGTREFADNDILIDPERTGDAKSWMLSHGYTFRTDDFSSDEYSKAPFYNFEIHRALIEESTQFETSVNYYRHVKDRLVKDGDNGFGYHFTDDDFYVFFIFHAFKHYDNRGTGFRTLADEYVILNAKRFRFDFAAIEKELVKLGILEFEQNLRALSDRLFSQPEAIEGILDTLSDEQREMLQYILSCGTFGSFDNLFAKAFAQSGNGKPPSKVKYYWKRVFPEISRFKYSNPFIYRHKVLYPFFLIYRMVVNPIRHKKDLKREIRTVKRLNHTDQS